MKRAALLALGALLLMGGAAWAQGLGNPATMVKQGMLDVGLQYMYMSEHKYKDATASISGVSGGVGFNDGKYKQDNYYGVTINYGITDWLNAALILGMADGGKGEFRYGAMGMSDTAEFELDSNFYWGVGAKARLWQFRNGLGFILGLQYLRFDDRDATNWRDSMGSLKAQGFNTSVQADMWQLDAMLTAYWKTGAFTPYVGVGYAYQEVKLDGSWNYLGGTNSSLDLTFKSNDNMTALVGFDARVWEGLNINVQGTFVGYTALTVGLSWGFNLF